jgi:hypothetical protein
VAEAEEVGSGFCGEDLAHETVAVTVRDGYQSLELRHD